MELTEGKEVILLQILLKEGAVLVVNLHKKLALGDLTCKHETGGLRIIPFSKIGNKISFFWISKLSDGDRIFFASLLGRLKNESSI